MNNRFLMSGILFLTFTLGAETFDELYQQGIGDYAALCDEMLARMEG